MTATHAGLQPATVSDVASAVREAAAAGSALRIVGRGRWLDAGRPVRFDSLLHLAALSGIVEYTPGDLTLTARAGTTLAEIARVTAAEGQWLPLAPCGGDEGSLGATIATASAGPLAYAMGLPRDTVLGVEFVSGAGDVVRGGGRVVKNVAGFDLTRLIVGSWGTLGVITELTVRLRALPECDETLVIPLDDRPGELAALLGRLRPMPIAPIALEIVNTTLARALGMAAAALLVRLAGNEQAVAGQRRALAQLASAERVNASVWDALRTAEPAAVVVCRLSGAPSRLAELWQRIAGVAASGGQLSASVQRGVARLAIAESDARAALAAAGGDWKVVFERLPAPLWAELGRDATADRLSRGVKRAFDPRAVLNPGILGKVEA